MATAPSLEAGFTSTLLGGCKSAAITEAATSTLNTENKVFIIEGPRVSILESIEKKKAVLFTYLRSHIGASS